MSLKGATETGRTDFHAAQDAIFKYVAEEEKKGRVVVTLSESQLKAMGIKTQYPALSVSRWKTWGEKGWATSVRGVKTLMLKKSAGAESFVPKGDVKPVEVDEGKLDPSFFCYPPEAPVIRDAMKLHRHVFLSGPTGCGKTELLERIAKKLEKEYIRQNLNGEVNVDDFLGVWVVKEHVDENGEKVREMIFKDGLLPQAMKQGKILILDEVDAGDAEVLFVLQAVLQSAELVNTKSGEMVKPREGFFVCATANTVGRGDMTSMYTGTNVLNEAFLDRFHYMLRMSYPPKEKEMLILQKRTGVEESIAEKIADLAQRVRAALVEKKIYSTFSVRKSINLAQAVVDFKDLKMALRMTVVDRISIDDAVVINEAIQRIFGIDMNDDGGVR